MGTIMPRLELFTGIPQLLCERLHPSKSYVRVGLSLLGSDAAQLWVKIRCTNLYRHGLATVTIDPPVLTVTEGKVDKGGVADAQLVVATADLADGGPLEGKPEAFEVRL